MAEGEPQYNIPVSSKQLIVYFVFLVIALTAAFLAGVMVGRNADSSPEPTVRDIQDGLPEDLGTSPTPDVLTYGSSLQSDKIEGLSNPETAVAPAAPSKPAPSVASARPAPSAALPAAPTPKATPAPTAKSRAAPSPKPTPTRVTGGTARSGPTPLARLTIQVGAFKERSAAEAIVKRLKGKGYSAYLVPVVEGLFNVRVGSFTDRESAVRIMEKLETQEKFKPFIVKP